MDSPLWWQLDHDKLALSLIVRAQEYGDGLKFVLTSFRDRALLLPCP